VWASTGLGYYVKSFFPHWCNILPLYDNGQTSSSHSNLNRFSLGTNLTLGHVPGLTPSPGVFGFFLTHNPHPTGKLHYSLSERHSISLIGCVQPLGRWRKFPPISECRVSILINPAYCMGHSNTVGYASSQVREMGI